jgi:hypothetical protein
VTIHLDRLHDIRDGSLADSNFQLADLNFKKLMEIVLDTGGKTVGVRFALDAGVVFSGGTASAGKSVTHGLGKAPVVVLCGCSQTGVVVTADSATFSSTSFTATGYFAAGATGTFKFSWVAIG